MHLTSGWDTWSGSVACPGISTWLLNLQKQGYEQGVDHAWNMSSIRVFFYNSHRVKSSLLSLELSFRSPLQGRQTSK